MSEGKAYVGSKISLISKSEIRYEGILYTIDPKEATVALAKVRSFGTEDRFTDKPIASRDDVYEYVIFRGKDIKDIKVCEPPQPQALIGGLPNDPAIVEAYQSNESRKQSFSPTGSFQSDYVGVTFGMQPYATHSGSRSTTPTQKRKSPTMDQGIQVSGTVGGTDKRETKRPPPQQNQRPLQPSNQQRQGPSGGSGQNRQQQQQQQQQQSNRGWVRRGGRGPRGGGGGGGGGRGGFNKPKEQLKFDGEYDFEQANAEFKEMESKFAKTQISDTVQNGTAPTTVTTDEKKEDSVTETTVAEVLEDESQTTFYDKTKSFFDSISCEALERSKGKFQRTDWRQERKLNVETFGVTNSYMRRGGYRGRGYRGRGGFRGGRSRGGGRGGMNQGHPFGQNINNRGLDNDRSNSQSRKPSQGWDTAEA